MPLSFPSGADGGGPIIGAVMATLPIRNTGTDNAINLQAASWDNVNSRILIGGNNDFTGTKTNVFAKMQQAANLPPSNNICVGIVVNRRDAGVLYLDGAGALFRTGAAFPAWTTITPPAVTSRRGMFTLASNARLYTVTVNLTIPDRNIEFSDDNGATWDSDPGLFAPVGISPNWIRTNRAGTLIGIGAVTEYVVSADPDDPASWETFTMATAGINQNVAAFSDDGLQMVVASANGQISTVTGGLLAGNEFDIPPADNPFAEELNFGFNINFCEFIPSLNGFLLASVDQEMIGFISSDNMTVCTPGLYLGTGPGATATFRNGISAVDDNGDAIFVGSVNLGAVFQRFN